MHGVLVIDKPAGRSSASVVEEVKRVLGVDRAGHGGTLDPLATGVLPICLGGGTKLAQYLLADDKAYEATGELGIEMDTLDRTGAVTATREVAVTEAAMRGVLAARLGDQDQVPPMYSAIKQQGVRMYHRARNGEHVERASRRIRIDRLELLAFEPPRFRVAIECSKGTYVRSIVADVGSDLGCGAHLAELRRTRSGRFSIAQAVPLAGLYAVDVAAHLIPCGKATGLPAVVVKPELHATIWSGNPLPIEHFTSETYPLFQLLDEAGRLLAIVHSEGGRIRYDRVFPDHATS
ncbi:MAG: tRNA pseudouridine(55) synthase TruB [Kofleriaceae bacterium]